MSPFFVRSHVDGVDSVAENEGEDRHDASCAHSGQAAHAHEKNVDAIREVKEHFQRDRGQGIIGFLVVRAATAAAAASGCAGGFLVLALLD